MTRFPTRIALSLGMLMAGFACVESAASADDPEIKPRVKLVMSSAERVLEDLEWIIATLAKEQTQWEDNLFPSLDIFLFGIDRDKPIRFDAMIGGEDGDSTNPGSYRFAPCLPVDRDGKDIRTFIRDNLEPIGIEVKLRARGGYYSLSGVYEGWMRMVDEYACIGTYESDIPKGMPHPEESHAELVKRGFDIALELDNREEQTEQRAEDFAVFEENLLDATKPKEGESEAEFALRKVRLKQNLEKFGGLYREAARVTVGWITDIEKEFGRADLYGAALPGTGLQDFIDMIATEHSVFAVLEVPEDPVASFRINLPFDETRRRHLAELYEHYRPVAHEKVDVAENITSSEKEPTKKAFDLLFDMLTEGIEVGRLDLFVDMTQTENHHVIIAGVRAADGKKADEIVKLIPESHTAWAVEMDVDSVGGTAIHKVDISGDLPEALRDTFGDSGAVYVGTSADLVWISGGEGSLELLKETITKVNEASPPADVSPVFGEFKAQVHTLLKVYDSLVVEMGWNPVGQIDVQARTETRPEGGAGLQPIDPAELREIATRATADINDRISGQARRVGDHAEGEIEVAPGVLRAVGKIIAKIAADNL